MLAAYLDESYDSGNSGFFVVGGVLGDSWTVLRCVDPWHKLLEKHRLTKFKATAMSRRPEVVAEFATSISNSGFFAFGLIANQEQVRTHLTGSILARQYKQSPYMLLYQFSFIRMAMKFRQRGANEAVSFVCDENARYLQMMTRSYPQLRSMNKQSAPYMGSLSMQPDDACAPLQMADLIVGEIRRKAPNWTQENTGFSPALKVLLDTETLGWVSVIDEGTLKSVRESVDARHTKMPE